MMKYHYEVDGRNFTRLDAAKDARRRWEVLNIHKVHKDGRVERLNELDEFIPEIDFIHGRLCHVDRIGPATPVEWDMELMEDYRTLIRPHYPEIWEAHDDIMRRYHRRDPMTMRTFRVYGRQLNGDDWFLSVLEVAPDGFFIASCRGETVIGTYNAIEKMIFEVSEEAYDLLNCSIGAIKDVAMSFSAQAASRKS